MKRLVFWEAGAQVSEPPCKKDGFDSLESLTGGRLSVVLAARASRSGEKCR